MDIDDVNITAGDLHSRFKVETFIQNLKLTSVLLKYLYVLNRLFSEPNSSREAPLGRGLPSWDWPN